MIESNKLIAKRFMQAMGSGDTVTIDSLITDDMIAICTGTSVVSGTRKRDEVVAAAAIFKQITKAGVDFEILTATAEDDRVALEMEGHGEMHDGKPYKNQYHFLFFLRDGKICKMKEYLDTKLADETVGALFAK